MLHPIAAALRWARTSASLGSARTSASLRWARTLASLGSTLAATSLGSMLAATTLGSMLVATAFVATALGACASPASSLPAGAAPPSSGASSTAPSSLTAPSPSPSAPPPAQGAPGTYRDPHAPIAVRVADLLARMTLPEKIAQLEAIHWDHTRLDDPVTHELSRASAAKHIALGIGEVTRPGDKHDARGAVRFANAVQKYLLEETRLGIPALLHEESLHGFVAPDATSFPQAIALAATFDPELVESVFTVAARQARARGVEHVLAPVLDVARDPRWGRIEETFGEDPYLVTRMGVAATLGLQGRRTADAPIDAQHVMATAKHFAGHGTPEGGRNTAPGNGSPHFVREVVFPPFEAAVREAGIASVMASYNEMDGTPSHANRWLLRDVLRGEWGFAGPVVSDYFGVAQLRDEHHVVADLAAAARTAIESGVDMELPEPQGFASLADEVTAGRVPIARIDEAVARVLRAKFQTGVFEHPFANEPPPAESAADRALALRAAEEAIVLLKNDGGLLPLDPARVRSIAVIGPNAAVCRLGEYSGVPSRVVSVAQGIAARLGDHATVRSAPGCGLTRGNRGWTDDVVELADPADDERSIAEAVKLSQAADVTVLVLGQNEQLSREAWSDDHRGDRMTLDLVGRQMDLARAVLAGHRPTVVLLIHGSPLSVPELAARAPALLDGFYLGEETGTAVAAVLFGDVSPAGRLPVTVPRSVGTLPAYYDHKPSVRRPYLFEDSGPLWPFGFGLTYASFRYGGLSVTPARIPPGGQATVTVTVTNTSARPSDEVVQLYVHDMVSSVTRPVQELRGFRRIHLGAGESKRVDMVLGPAELSFYDVSMHRVVEPGTFDVMVGGSSADVQHTSFEVVAP